MSTISLFFLLIGLAVGIGIAYAIFKPRFSGLESGIRAQIQTQENELKVRQEKLNTLLPLEGEIKQLRESLTAQAQRVEETSIQSNVERELR